MGNIVGKCLAIYHCRVSNGKRRSYLSTNVIGKEFIELDSYCIKYYYPIKTHIETNGDYTRAHLSKTHIETNGDYTRAHLSTYVLM
jgi:hypothetical protein